MAESRFVYVIYIRTTAARLWQALLEPEFTRQFWAETWQECEWKVGATWGIMLPDGRFRYSVTSRQPSLDHPGRTGR